MGREKYNPEIHGDQSETESDSDQVPETPPQVSAAGQQQPEEEDYYTASQERLEHLIRAARRNKTFMPAIYMRRAKKFLELIMPIFNRRFPGKKVHNYQSLPPPPRNRSSS